MRTVLVTGAASGLGAAFREVYAAIEGTHVISVDIQALNSGESTTATTTSTTQHFIVDISAESAVQELAQTLKGVAVDLLIHSAGIRGLVKHAVDSAADVESCETLALMDVETMEQTFRINTIGTFLLLKALLPNLRMASVPQVVVMSSRMGSLSNNQSGNRAAGGGYAYRASKAALNAVIRSFAVDEPDITFVMCHPGRVETGLVKWKEQGAIDVRESVQGLMPLIASWTRRDTGRFYDRFGEVIEW